MIIKEKIIFLALLPVLVATIAIGINTQENKKRSTDEFLKDIESVTEKAKAKKKVAKDSWDIDGLKKQETMEDYLALAERNIFFRPVSEVRKEIQRDIVSLKEEEPKKPLFVYKGRMTMGARIIVIIEDQNTSKSFSVKEGDSAGDFTVVSIGEKEILLRKNDGEEIIISTVKEEKKEERKDAEGGRDRSMQTDWSEGIDEKK
ncbi:MAG: hypothetical protein Q7O04_05130 [Candidatus Omnitrophota bacterium]|nr:hypothetical protein [Candidatus Omnitrophota bacterium]